MRLRRASAAEALVDARLTSFKAYVRTYWDLVPDSRAKWYRGDSLIRMRPSQLLDEVLFLIIVSDQESMRPAYWNCLVELKRAAWVTNGWWDQDKRPMSRNEFWVSFRAKLVSAVSLREDLLP